MHLFSKTSTDLPLRQSTHTLTVPGAMRGAARPALGTALPAHPAAARRSTAWSCRGDAVRMASMELKGWPLRKGDGNVEVPGASAVAVSTQVGSFCSMCSYLCGQLWHSAGGLLCHAADTHSSSSFCTMLSWQCNVCRCSCEHAAALPWQCWGTLPKLFTAWKSGRCKCPDGFPLLHTINHFGLCSFL